MIEVDIRIYIEQEEPWTVGRVVLMPRYSAVGVAKNVESWTPKTWQKPNLSRWCKLQLFALTSHQKTILRLRKNNSISEARPHDHLRMILFLHLFLSAKQPENITIVNYHWHMITKRLLDKSFPYGMHFLL